MTIRNRKGALVLQGPRVSGEHENVFDHWAVDEHTPPHRQGPALVVCMDCGARWPEGASSRPELCER